MRETRPTWHSPWHLFSASRFGRAALHSAGILDAVRWEGAALDAESVAGHLLEPGSVFALLAEHRDRLFPGELFADLFPTGRGRPSIPGEVVASVIVLQALYGHSDRDAVDALTFDLRWKAACGYAIDAKGFDPSTLTFWRRRLAASDRPQRIFEVVRDVIADTGAVAGRQRRALDSTTLDDPVTRQDTVTQLIAQFRRVGRGVPGAKDLIATERTAPSCTSPPDSLAAGADSTSRSTRPGAGRPRSSKASADYAPRSADAEPAAHHDPGPGEPPTGSASRPLNDPWAPTRRHGLRSGPHQRRPETARLASWDYALLLSLDLKRQPLGVEP